MGWRMSARYTQATFTAVRDWLKARPYRNSPWRPRAGRRGNAIASLSPTGARATVYTRARTRARETYASTAGDEGEVR